ncbi:hypothetical protein MKAN_12380 [Mycobacterium kansasii ATCC 12478]|uniref:Uncharacterized protein n=1 Tax=Mycobacterium kansasii ATCC 12478 TaxID=557599 RepID=U5WYL6_MYCKA|nr:hypothetical protein MKAN_12380 [Mycobacterium kansasii ATCC 12478]
MGAGAVSLSLVANSPPVGTGNIAAILLVDVVRF